MISKSIAVPVAETAHSFSMHSGYIIWKKAKSWPKRARKGRGRGNGGGRSRGCKCVGVGIGVYVVAVVVCCCTEWKAYARVAIKKFVRLPRWRRVVTNEMKCIQLNKNLRHSQKAQPAAKMRKQQTENKNNKNNKRIRGKWNLLAVSEPKATANYGQQNIIQIKAMLVIRIFM